MNKKHFKKITPLLLSLMIFFGVVFSFSNLANPMIAEGDAYSRVNTALEQKSRGYYFNKYGGTWLPLHFTMMVTLLSVLDYPFLVPRLLTLFLSLGSVVLLYFYTKFFTKKKSVALLSSFIFLLLPLRIYLGVQPLSESIFIFFFILSLLPILKNKLSYWEILLSLFFLNIAHGIRYESWMVLPLIWLFISSKPIGLLKKIFFIFLSTLFIIYWMHANYIYRGDFLAFFQEKYEVAKLYEKIEYFNFGLSFSTWLEKLIPVFPIPFLVLSFVDLKNLIKKFNFQNIFYYSLPFVFFGALVAQVFLGTMEWFPTRYLLIPIVFLIPPLASSIHIYFNFLHKLFLKKELFKKIISPLFFLISIFILQYFYFHSLEYARLETNDSSFFSNYTSNETIESNHLYVDFFDLVEKCRQLCGNEIIFFHVPEEEGKTYLDQSLFYFLLRSGFDYPKKDVEKHIEEKSIFVWERSSDDESGLIENFHILYENERFYILEN